MGPSGGSTPGNTLSSRLLLTSSSIKGARIKRVEAEEVTGSGIRASSCTSFAKSKVRSAKDGKMGQRSLASLRHEGHSS